MGLFDKRDRRKGKGDDFDSPVEKIDLSAETAPEPKPKPKPAAEQAKRAAAASTPKRPARVEPEEDDDYDPPEYGIDKAIELMRSLPGDNVELVVQVVKHTLESTRIKISKIIDDASRKQSDIQGRIKVLNAEISEYEQEIATRKKEIGELEADYEETTTVKDRLVLAENLSKKERASAVEKKSPLGAKPVSPAKPALAKPGSDKPASPLGKKPTIVAKK